MRSKLHQFVIVMKILRADHFCFVFCLRLCVSKLVSVPWDLLSFVCVHSHAGFISFFCFVHMGKHGCGLIICTLYTVCMVIAFDYVKK